MNLQLRLHLAAYVAQYRLAMPPQGYHAARYHSEPPHLVIGMEGLTVSTMQETTVARSQLRNRVVLDMTPKHSAKVARRSSSPA